MPAAAKSLAAKRTSYHVWSEENYVTAYELARQGMGDCRIAEAMGVSYPTFLDWKKKHKAFASALKRGAAIAKQSDGQGAFRDYVYKRLPPHLKDLWEEINAWEGHRNAQKKIEELLAGQGVRVRQHLWIYALTASNFNASAACRKVNVSKSTLDEWKLKDPDFAELLKEIDFHKGNFFEAGLIRAVNANDISAILFANQTFNRERGYGRQVDVKVSGEVTHNHNMLDLDRLQLRPEILIEIHHAIEKQEEAERNLIAHKNSDVIDSTARPGKAINDEDDE